MKGVKQVLRVQPGNRVEIVAPEFAEGDLVDVIILPRNVEVPQTQQSVVAFIDALPDGPRAFATWDAYEQHLRQERDSWER